MLLPECDTDQMPKATGHPARAVSTGASIVTRIRANLRISGNFWLLLGFSVFYFVDVCIRASRKYFWYDELFTVFLSRLPDFHSLWDALRHGADFNPPLLYLLTRLSQTIFGTGLVGTRLPEIAGFWVMCLCLFRFVNRRVGRWGGSIAMALPMLTGAFYYSYEARPYGVILGFCGLALICWQEALDSPRRSWWLTGLSLSLFGAFMLQCYALIIVAPFALTEALRTVRSRRIDWPMWLALIAPVLVAVPTYIPLLQAYSSQAKGTDYAQAFAAHWSQVTKFYLFLLTPWLLIGLAAVVLLAIDRIWTRPQESRRGERAESEIIAEIALLVFLMALPAVGVILGKTVHGPIFVRYFLPAVMGVCALTGFAAGAHIRKNWLAVCLAAIIGGALGLQFARLLWHVHKGWGEPLNEPTTGISLDTMPGQPLDIHPLLASQSHGSLSNSSLPIGVPLALDFLYLVHYSPELAPRLYLINPSANDFTLRGFRRVYRWIPVKYDHLLTDREFLRMSPHSLVYCDELSIRNLFELVREGGTIQSVKESGRHYLAEIKAEPVQISSERTAGQ